jgi:hypothetical protein
MNRSLTSIRIDSLRGIGRERDNMYDLLFEMNYNGNTLSGLIVGIIIAFILYKLPDVR